MRSRAAPLHLDFSRNCRRCSGKGHLVWSFHFFHAEIGLDTTLPAAVRARVFAATNFNSYEAHRLKPGNANLPIGDLRTANREIGVPRGASQRHFAGAQSQCQDCADYTKQRHLNFAGQEPTAVTDDPPKKVAAERGATVQAGDEHS
jgi:hypothetical protein